MEIDNFLSSNGINLEYTLHSVEIDHFNLKYPIKNSFLYRYTKLYPSMLYKYSFLIKTINYIDDLGSVFEDEITYTKNSYDSLRSKTEISLKGPKLLIPGSFVF